MQTYIANCIEEGHENFSATHSCLWYSRYVSFFVLKRGEQCERRLMNLHLVDIMSSRVNNDSVLDIDCVSHCLVFFELDLNKDYNFNKNKVKRNSPIKFSLFTRSMFVRRTDSVNIQNQNLER